ncbi:hypothetical protein HOLleu_23161 [Holothuria leucospilota]|uniref:Uncharacterized protein n=1 Tax=Holothuria leucospilota TaxID=206669 RepID=A0A9Q1BUR7_HOLLE|nr:hypothetical protein HOLleu_23161 [Holothuria leucospilota]
MEDPDWWKTIPCHFNPDWNLHEQSELDVRKLKHQVKDDLRSAPTVMRVESLLYQAFLEMPPKPFFRFELPSPQNALILLKEAEDFIEITMRNDVDAQNGYGIVINALRMWIYGDRGNATKREKIESTLKKLKFSQNKKSRAFVNATHAAALSRLGLKRCKEAMHLFEMALEQFPNKTHWMFVRAIMQGRLARSDRSTMYGNRNLSNTLKIAFERERELLQQIKEIEPDFAWPIAYLGQCLYNLNRRDDALKCIKQAIRMDKRNTDKNTDIALISARVYKWDKQFSKSEEILKSLPEESKTAEVFFQLGLIYDKRAKELRQRPGVKMNCDKNKLCETLEYKKLLKTALEYVEQSLEKDICHFAAANKMAELRALLADRERAKRMYLDLLQRDDALPLNQFHIRRSANLNHIKKLFDKSDVLDNIFKMLDLCIRNFTTFDETGVGKFDDTVKNDAEIFLLDLEQMSNDDSYELKFLAKKFLAQIKRRLGKYEDSIKLILSLIDQPGMNMSELRWNLGKCYCGLGELDKAEGEAKTLTELPPKRKFRAEEIYADVYLARAKEKQTSKDKEGVNYMIENLQKAINKGSIEACYLYLTKVEHLQERLCSVEETIVQTIAEIEACLERSDNFHEKFDRSPGDRDPIDYIQERITTILFHPGKTIKSLPGIIVKRYDSLSDMRKYLRDFEGCYLRVSRDSWNKVCQEATKKVLTKARELLDHVIFDYQKEVRRKPGNPEVTKFPVHMDWNKAEVDKDLVKTKFKGYVESKFPGYSMPGEMVTFFIELQPMYSRDNLWLAALCEFTGKKKHTGRDDELDTHYIDLKVAENIPYKKVDLVRRSCYEVEKIVENLLSFLQIHFYPYIQDTAPSSSAACL